MTIHGFNRKNVIAAPNFAFLTDGMQTLCNVYAVFILPVPIEMFSNQLSSFVPSSKTCSWRHARPKCLNG